MGSSTVVEAALARGVGDHPPGKGEQDPRAFHQAHAFQAVFGEIFQREQPGINQLHDENGAFVASPIGVDAQRHFVMILAQRFGFNIHVDLDFRRPAVSDRLSAPLGFRTKSP